MCSAGGALFTNMNAIAFDLVSEIVNLFNVHFSYMSTAPMLSELLRHLMRLLQDLCIGDNCCACGICLDLRYLPIINQVIFVICSQGVYFSVKFTSTP